MRYAGAWDQLARFAEASGVPVAATQAGKSALPEAHPNYVGSLGVTGASAANELARQADIVLAWAAVCRILPPDRMRLSRGR